MIQNSKTESPIEEIHRIRREISDRFGGDLAAIAEDAARRQAASHRPVWQPKGMTANGTLPHLNASESQGGEAPAALK